MAKRPCDEGGTDAAAGNSGARAARDLTGPLYRYVGIALYAPESEMVSGCEAGHFHPLGRLFRSGVQQRVVFALYVREGHKGV